VQRDAPRVPQKGPRTAKQPFYLLSRVSVLRGASPPRKKHAPIKKITYLPSAALLRSAGAPTAAREGACAPREKFPFDLRAKAV